jgi:hypothetical protein
MKDYMERVSDSKSEISSSDSCYNCSDCVYNTESDDNDGLPCGQYRCWHVCEIAQENEVSAFDL